MTHIRAGVVFVKPASKAVSTGSFHGVEVHVERPDGHVVPGGNGLEIRAIVSGPERQVLVE